MHLLELLHNLYLKVVRKGSSCISHVMMLGYSLLTPLAIQLPVNRRGGLGSILHWNNSLPLLPHPAASCEHTHLSMAGVPQRGNLQLLPRAEHLNSLTCRGAHSYTTEKMCIDARAWPSPSALDQKTKKGKKTPKINDNG